LNVAEPVLTRIEPIFSPRPWGARSLAPLFPDKADLQEPLGEAWLTAHESRVGGGPFAGKSLGEAWRTMPVEWRGTRCANVPEFPLLIKFLFPHEKLSVQVHPDDAYAAKHEQAAGGRGKTEMWHIVEAHPGAELLLGLKPDITKDDFLDSLKSRTVEKLLHRIPVQPGETYFVEPGTQHAICPVMVVCEVQEYSDLTYRVYDYGRVDASGKARELHLEKALEVTRFEGTRSGKVPPLALHSPDAKKHLLAACEFFATEHWECDRMTMIEGDTAEFQLLIILQGSGTLHDVELATTYRSGQAWFLPASLPMVMLQPKQQTSLLRVTVPDVHLLRRQLRNQGFENDAISRVLMD
jgi:mannose-6-phosphate isomerase